MKEIIVREELINQLVGAIDALSTINEEMKSMKNDINTIKTEIKNDIVEWVEEYMEEKVGIIEQFVTMDQARKRQYTDLIDKLLSSGGVEEYEKTECRELVKNVFLFGLGGKKWKDVNVELIQKNESKLYDAIKTVLGLKARNKQLTIGDINIGIEMGGN